MRYAKISFEAPLRLLLFFMLTVAGSSVRAEESFVANLSLGSEKVHSLRQSGIEFRKSKESKNIFLSFPTKEGVLTLRVRPIELLTASARRRVSLGGGVENNIYFFEGEPNEGNPKDFARFTLADLPSGSTFTGIFQKNGKLYDVSGLNALGESLRGMSDGTQLVVAEANFESAPTTCATVDSGSHPGDSTEIVSQELLSAAAATNLRELELAYDLDYDFLQLNGGLAAAKAKALSIINGVSGIYQSQLNIRIRVSFEHAWESWNQPYTVSDISSQLQQFQSYWESNFRSSARYDVAHLFSGKGAGSGAIGIAWVRAVCGAYAYGVAQRVSGSAAEVVLTAHEIGHNLGANHDDGSPGFEYGYVMWPSLIPSSNAFSTGSKGVISNAVEGSFSCMATVDNTPPTPTATSTPSSLPPTSTPTVTRTPASTPSPEVDAEEWELLRLLNEYRVQNGVQPVQLSITLTNAAAWMSNDLATSGIFSHTDSLGRDPYQRMQAFGYNYQTWWGENIAGGNSTALGTINQWKGSPGHNAAMLSSDFRVIGIGRAYGPNSAYRWYWTLKFGGYVDATYGGGGDATPTMVPTLTFSPTSTRTSTRTATPTLSSSPVPTATRTPGSTSIPTSVPTNTPSVVPTSTRTPTATPTVTNPGSLPAPTGVSAADGTPLNYLQVKWNYVSGAHQYRVYRSTGIGQRGFYVGSARGGSTTPFFRDFSAKAGVRYFYGVTTIASNGSESALSVQDAGSRASSLRAKRRARRR